MFTNETEREFDERIKKEWESPVVYDGITHIDSYKKTQPKILWIMKETNENGNGEDRYHRDFHQHVKDDYPQWKRTYKKIILTSYGLINKKNYFDMLDIARDKELKGCHEVLWNIAFINVKKTGGKAKSQSWEIEQSYKKHKDTLLFQIDCIEPDIIINCSRVSAVFDDIADKYNLTKQQTKVDEWPINFASNSKKLIIDYWHPNAHINENWYCTQIIDIYNSWQKS